MVLRVKRPEFERKFRTPFVPVVPLMELDFPSTLLSSLPPITWIRFIVWMIIGLVIYVFYGKRKSNLAENSGNVQQKEVS
jgi:basic amino acid/polyamine antiporter, APA family